MGELNIKFKAPDFGDWRKGDQKIFCSDNSRALKLLNWKPTTLLRLVSKNCGNGF